MKGGEIYEQSRRKVNGTESNLQHELVSKFDIVENVPARVNEETGEQYFAPETVEHLHKTIRSNTKPKKWWKLPFLIIRIKNS